MKKFLGLVLFFLIAINFLNSQENQNSKNDSLNKLFLSQDDLFIEQNKTDPSENGFHLYIRKKDGIESVMLTETSKDPSGKADNYSYRALEWNKYNGNEKRILNGKELNSKYALYSLVSSTVENHKKFGKVFHIYIPQTLEYGYPWTRNGKVLVGKGTFINIRTFSKKYCDYSGEFFDNPFMFDFSRFKKNPPEDELVLTDDYNSLAAQKFTEIANAGGGIISYSKENESLAEDLLKSLDKLKGNNKIDVVFVIDSTGSMKDDLEILKNQWIPKFTKQIESFPDYRIASLFYRDFNDSYNYKGLPVKYFAFTNQISKFTKYLNTVSIKGNEGGDVPEAVFEALYAALEFYDWREDACKKIILLGDAEPHPYPRGPKKISQETVIKIASEKNIILDCIIVPDNKKF